MINKNLGKAIAELDLNVLKYTENTELFELIRAEHPKWSDECINRQIQDTGSPDFAKWYKTLFKEANNE